MSRHVAVIGAGIVRAASAMELQRAGHHVTPMEQGGLGGERATRDSNVGWLCGQPFSMNAGWFNLSEGWLAWTALL